MTATLTRQRKPFQRFGKWTSIFRPDRCSRPVRRFGKLIKSRKDTPYIINLGTLQYAITHLVSKASSHDWLNQRRQQALPWFQFHNVPSQTTATAASEVGYPSRAIIRNRSSPQSSVFFAVSWQFLRDAVRPLSRSYILMCR